MSFLAKEVNTWIFCTRTRATGLLHLLYWADFSWSCTVLAAVCPGILESCIHALPRLHWPFHLHLCDSCGTHGYYWETDFWPVSMNKNGICVNVLYEISSQQMQCHCIDVRLFVITQEQPKVQGLSSRGHICQSSWSILGDLWKLYSLHCYTKILETAHWPGPAQPPHQRGGWPRPVTAFWGNRFGNFQWHQEEELQTRGSGCLK